ncbi:MAG: tRNA glutamyl-Q(34) synthetase GluQRS [Rhodospirillales bacterium]
MIVTRFAPSPTGNLHLGHAHSALGAWRTAREAGGRFLLRIEDIDGTRCRDEFVDDILTDLAWLGIDWDGPVIRQSDRGDAYREALDRLDAAGLLYPCFCTRKEIMAEFEAAGGAPHGFEGPVYPGTCRHLSRDEAGARIGAGDPHALRLDSESALATTGDLSWHDCDAGTQALDMTQTGDVVLARKDIGNSYHLAVTVDDAWQGINLVVRGIDLFQATHVHRLLQALLGLPVPDYAHHPLLTDADGERLAKRAGSLSLKSMREEGASPADVRRLAGFPD